MVNQIKDRIVEYARLRTDTVHSKVFSAYTMYRDYGEKEKILASLKDALAMSLKAEAAFELYDNVRTIEKNNGEE